MARKKVKKGDSTCTHNNNGECQVFIGLDCPCDKMDSCPDWKPKVDEYDQIIIAQF